MVSENGDPPDIAIRRTGGNGNYPNEEWEPIVSGQNIGTIYWQALNDEYEYQIRQAQISVRAAEDPTHTAGGGDMFLSTTSLGENNPTERISIMHDGKVGIATTTPHTTLEVNGSLSTPPGSNLTISGGAVTVTSSMHLIDTEDASSSDDLEQINGGYAGQVLALSTVNSGRDVTVKDGYYLRMHGDFSLNDTDDVIVLRCINTTPCIWRQEGGSDNS